MKILLVIPEYPPHAGGGIVTFYRTLLPELVKQGHQVRALVGSAFTSRLQGYVAEGVEVEFLDHELVTANLSRFESFRPVPHLQRHLAAAWTAYDQANRGHDYDVVETVDWGLLFVPWVVERTAPPAVVQLHGSVGQIDFHDPKRGDELLGRITRLLELQILGAADGLQSYSRMNAADWEAITRRPVSYIPPAWTPPAALERGPRSDHGVVVGRIQFWKGPTVLCEALRLLGGAAPVIDWVGRDTPFGDAGRSMSAHLGQAFPDVWGTTLRPMGPCAPEEIQPRLARAAFSLVPSTWDVFNFTCIEAMGAEQIVICSTGAGASGLITDGENGLVVPANDAEALAGKIDQLMSMPSSQRSAIGRAARHTVLSQLNPSAIAARRILEYETVIRVGKSAGLHPWIADAVRPHTNSGHPLGFLDNLPLRELSEYTIRRGLKRNFS